MRCGVLNSIGAFIRARNGFRICCASVTKRRPPPRHPPSRHGNPLVIHRLKAETAGGRTRFRPIWPVFRRASCGAPAALHAPTSCMMWSFPRKGGKTTACSSHTFGYGRSMRWVASVHHMRRSTACSSHTLGYVRKYAAGGFSPPFCSDAEASAK